MSNPSSYKAFVRDKWAASEEGLEGIFEESDGKESATGMDYLKWRPRPSEAEPCVRLWTGFLKERKLYTEQHPRCLWPVSPI